MPLPTPRKGETRQTFVARCVGSEVMRNEYPKLRQRLAVCYSQYRRKERSDQERTVLPQRKAEK